jgi:hypothetical protein
MTIHYTNKIADYFQGAPNASFSMRSGEIYLSH